MNFRISTGMLALLIASSCDKFPITLETAFSKLPSGDTLTEAETQTVKQGLMTFLGLRTPPEPLELRASGIRGGPVNVCGIANQNRFFVGYLRRTDNALRFDIKHVSDSTSAAATYEVDIRRLCGL